jgi:hypothetical protein
MQNLTDQKDREILATRLAAYESRNGMTTGDAIQFSDGKIMRIAYIHRHMDGAPFSVQPCWGGSFHMHKSGHCEMSGGLETGIDPAEFQPTEEKHNVSAWFFHHDYAGAGMGRDFTYPARVWKIDRPAPRKWSETYRLCQVDSKYAKEMTCGNYHYLVTLGGTSHTAFEKESDFLAWMKSNNLTLSEPLAPRGQYANQILERAK